ncbi:MAG: DUF4296 domain-containing protein [Bacteroidales bacterium]|nr:DUF4296 domain-containing protein [Bacteroidales bacterium]MBR7168533.1 DUF4296 domain-containing protein [Bacteroidales bacterium]
MKKILILLCSLLGLCSCSSDKVPEGVIPEDTMVPILAEMHLANAYFSVEYTDDSLAYSQAVNYTQKQVLDKYGITFKQFGKTIAYYTDNPEKFKGIYEKVIQQLDKK